MTTITKTFAVVEANAAPLFPGRVKDNEVVALISTYGLVDHQGDVVLGPRVDAKSGQMIEGAFDASIREWRQSGKMIPMIWSHQWGDPNAYIGEIDPHDLRSVAPGEFPSAPHGGLLMKAMFADTPSAQHARDLIKRGLVTEYSYAFDLVKSRKRSDGAQELLVLNIIEAGPTLRGASIGTATIDVKSQTGTITRSRADMKRARSKKAIAILQMVRDHPHKDRVAASKWGALAGRLERVVNDDSADENDVRESAAAWFHQELALAEYARTDAIVAKRWNDLSLKRSVEELVALDSVVNVDEQLTKQVDEFVAETKALVAKERQEKAVFDAYQLDLARGGRPPGFGDPVAERERDLAEQQRDLDRINAKAAERAAERARVLEFERISREERDWRGGNADFYATNTPLTTFDAVDDRDDRLDVRITDKTQPDGESFSLPVVARPNTTVERDDPPLPVVPEAAETLRLPVAGVVTPDHVVEGDTIRLQVGQREDDSPLRE
jgi:phage head maturation protease